MAFNERLLSARSARGMTVLQLANAAGVAESSVRNWEKGRRTPRPETMVKLAVALDVDTGDLTGNHQRTPPPPAFSVQPGELGEVKERAAAINEQFTRIGDLIRELDDTTLTILLFDAQRAFIAFTVALITGGPS